MLHDILISTHAASGVIAFAAGCAAVYRPRAFRTYFWSLLALVAFMAAVITVDWRMLDTSTRVLFLSLAALGVYTVAGHPGSPTATRRFVPAI